MSPKAFFADKTPDAKFGARSTVDFGPGDHEVTVDRRRYFSGPLLALTLALYSGAGLVLVAGPQPARTL
jgi:hypothetical protein